VLCADLGLARIELALVLVRLTPARETVTWIALEPF